MRAMCLDKLEDESRRYLTDKLRFLQRVSEYPYMFILTMEPRAAAMLLLLLCAMIITTEGKGSFRKNISVIFVYVFSLDQRIIWEFEITSLMDLKRIVQILYCSGLFYTDIMKIYVQWLM